MNGKFKIQLMLLEVKTKDNKTIRLLLNQWKHIIYRHPEMSNKINEIESALVYSDYKKEFINRINYYKYLKKEKKYIMVAVRVFNGEGIIITTYLTNKIKK